MNTQQPVQGRFPIFVFTEQPAIGSAATTAEADAVLRAATPEYLRGQLDGAMLTVANGGQTCWMPAASREWWQQIPYDIGKTVAAA